jgi:RNA polymerase sigma-70 factor (ECF subfamily)
MTEFRKTPPVSIAALPESAEHKGRSEWLADKELMNRIARGDAEAFRSAARRLLPRLRRVTQSLLHSAADAQDATQNALLELLRAAPAFRGESSLETWSDSIAVRCALRVTRRRERKHLPMSEAPEPCSAASGGLEDALPRPLLDYLARLQPERRQAIALRYVLDYSVDEIAAALGSPRNTVKYWLREGLSELRAHIRRDQLAGGGGRKP